jgi:hypothetical protein
MELPLVIGLIVILLVGFFAFQWVSSSSRKTAIAAAQKKAPVPVVAKESEALLGEATPSLPQEEKMPEVAGQTEAELREKEPVQRRVPVTVQEPVTAEGHAPADFQDTLRRPEQSFHQPQQAPPSMYTTDVPSGRAGVVASPGDGHMQGFSPEMAQNGGAMVGGVFAYDGMEPTGFADF